MCVLTFLFFLCQTCLRGVVCGEYDAVKTMSRTIPAKAPWLPQTQLERDSVFHELQLVVSSPHFCNSKRYPALLRYVVENTLAGRSDLLKERTLGIEVFDRPPTYDTNADTVVRYTAGEVRKRLLLYYSEPGHDSGVRISLPTGSYIPEFLLQEDSAGAAESEEASAATSSSVSSENSDRPLAGGGRESSAAALSAVLNPSAKEPDARIAPALGTGSSWRKRWTWIATAAALALLAVLGLGWRHRAGSSQTAIDDFWAPVFHEQRTAVICTGGVVFKQENFSGVMTASKDAEYPFVSMQIASAISQVSSLVNHFGATSQLLPSPSTPLTELRDHPVILLGGYNNQWAMRLLQAQRYRFTYEPLESIGDRTQPQIHWSRDRSIPYSSADDFALVARFRDPTTGSWVVVLAGLGRNGTEAAAQFATSPAYMQQLQDRLGQQFSNRSVEAVLKVRVIDGKTGAPSVEAVAAW